MKKTAQIREKKAPNTTLRKVGKEEKNGQIRTKKQLTVPYKTMLRKINCTNSSQKNK